MKTRVVERVYFVKPEIGKTRANAFGTFTIERVGELTKDIMGREYYEMVLCRIDNVSGPDPEVQSIEAYQVVQ